MELITPYSWGSALPRSTPGSVLSPAPQAEDVNIYFALPRCTPCSIPTPAPQAEDVNIYFAR
jgi:hypothetical protein